MLLCILTAAGSKKGFRLHICCPILNHLVNIFKKWRRSDLGKHFWRVFWKETHYDGVPGIQDELPGECSSKRASWRVFLENNTPRGLWEIVKFWIHSD